MPSKRIYWGKKYSGLPPLNLTEIQTSSWRWFVSEGIAESLTEVFPVEDFTGKNWLLELGDHSVEKPAISADQAARKGLTYSSALRVAAKLTNKQTGKTTSAEVFLGEIPQMTDRGTFIINGVERVVINQVVRSPGVYFSSELDPASGKMLARAELRPIRGTWLEFEITRGDVIYVRIDRRRKFVVTTLLRAMGMSPDQLLFDPYLQTSAAKDVTTTAEEALLEIYKKMRPGEPMVLDNAQKLMFDLFFNPRRYDLGRVGRYKINKRLATASDSRVLTREDLVGVVKQLIVLQHGQGQIDDIDHLANRRVRRVGELVAQTAFREGLLRLERAIKEKMSLVSTEELVAPTQLVNARPVISAINQFFRSSQLSQIIDQTNPLAEIDHLRRLSVFGPGGLTRERASFSIRDINSSQYSRIDPVRSPEGPNIGLVTYLALYPKVNDYGFLEAPYRRVIHAKGKARVTDKVVYLDAADEEQYHISYSDIATDAKGNILDKWVPFRYQGAFIEGPVAQLDFVDVVPRQVVGTSASLIPFLQNDAANRALMGTNMQSQAVPLIRPTSPVVGTGMEGDVAEALGWTVRARHTGRVSYVDAAKIIVKPDHQRDAETYHLTKFRRTTHNTCFNQRPVVTPGQKVKVGDLLIDGPACDGGELALGQNMVIAYHSFEGLGYEDAIVIAERRVTADLLTSIHIGKY